MPPNGPCFGFSKPSPVVREILSFTLQVAFPSTNCSRTALGSSARCAVGEQQKLPPVDKHRPKLGPPRGPQIEPETRMHCTKPKSSGPFSGPKNGAAYINYKKEWVHFLAPFLGPRFWEIWVRGGFENEGGHTEKGCVLRGDV